ncbi:MAG: glycosyltransferase family 2 protein [Crocinitomicaceae bacterium]|jgi:glycosyltransferase involved in cell wall biosynthesis|nr:glycosyltransferase family 2 protein [Crocinitomicaceae bacterium]MBT6029800.1 glycosyltransferase family 2 protein [Crocinitomicaceae bacterium]MBT6513491.1 glycosyltransferase family 2 protein [Crocinitomicaceae bacterium]MDG2330686.1 glycosyltransferase family 2 protein [Flavobacteriales bacterium]
MNNPLISVVMPAYNAENYIEQAISSILNQTYVNIELLIADDGSTDDTKEKINLQLANDERVKVFHNQSNIGYLKTCNKLKALATGDYITFQDADDFSDLKRLEVLMTKMNEDSTIDVVGSNFCKVLEDGQIVSTSDHAVSHEQLVDSMPETFLFCGASFLLKREVYDNIGGYHEYFDRVGAEDFYWVYLITEKFKVEIINDALYYYRFNPNSVSATAYDKRKLFSVDLVRFLITQRQNTGSDALTNNRLDLLDARINELNQPYINDKYLFSKKLVQRYFWNGKYRSAYWLAFSILIRNPFQSKAFYKDICIYLPKWIKG